MIDLSKHSEYGDRWLYDSLQSFKQEEIPANFKLKVFYTSDNFNNENSIGLSLWKFYEYISIIDFPCFFIHLYTNKSDISSDLKFLKTTFTPNDVDINVQDIGGSFQKKLKNKESFCILPWISLHINAQGLVAPCCQFNENYPIGNVKNDNLFDIINGDKLKEVRKQMLTQQRPDICSNCWVQEDNDALSLRQTSNQIFSKYIPLKESTNTDGSIDSFKLKYIDFRASNICNMKCRMCGGNYSSKIAQEDLVLYPNITINKNFIENKLDKQSIKNVLMFIENHVDELDNIYFAGGEPLIMYEHYKILDLLLEHKKHDVNISYNSNLSTLKFKNYNLLDYWQKFKNITLNASIDLIGDRASYVRSGVNYDTIENNYTLIKHLVDFKIDSTLTIYNAFNLMDLQQHWIKTYNISPTKFYIRLSMLPPYVMSCQVLPEYFKKQVTEKIKNHINWLEQIFDSNSLIQRWHDVLQFLNAKDQSHLLKEFFRLNDTKDAYRNEKFTDIFPEYKDLKNYV